MEAEIRALLQEAGVSFKQNSKSFIMDCPRCKKVKKLYIRRRDGRFVCWYCRETDGFHGRPEYALAELCGVPIKEIQDKLYGDGKGVPTETYLQIDINDFEDEEDYIDLEPDLQEVVWPLDFYPLDHEFSLRGVRYLESRGVPGEIAKEYGVRYHPAKQSLIFPVQQEGRLLGWQTRTTVDIKPYWDPKTQKLVKPLKALTDENLKRDRILMFADRLKSSKHCVLTEGPFDALKAHLCGGNVASLGKAVTDFQISLILNSGVEKVYLGLDPDAYLEVDRIRKKMPGVILYDLRPPEPHKDLGAMPMLNVKDLFDHAKVLSPTQVVIFLKNHFGA